MNSMQTGKADAAHESGQTAVRTAVTGMPTPRAAVHLRFGAFELDEANACLLRDGRALPLPPTPFAVLCALARRPGSLLTKNGLLDEVWGHQFVSESVLKSVITKLRTLLGDEPRQPQYIETVSRRGYRFIAAVTPLPDVPSARAIVQPPALPQSPQFPQSPQVQTFVGRENELLRLHAAWDIACSGRRKLVWVAGDLGIGKTTLIERFVAGLGDVVCARGQCVEQYGTGEPYLPVLEALAELCRRDATVAPMLRAVAPTWLLQLPWLGTAEERESVRRDLAGVGPDRMLREMGELLDRYTETRPLLLVTEDLHWSDRATLQLMNHVTRRRGNACLMWLASFRLAEVVALDHPLKALREELRPHGLCEEIVLDPFSEREVADYVAQRAPPMAADEAFVRALHERSDGVPLFVAHVIRDAIERAAQGRPDDEPAPRLARMAVPENLASLIDHYIAKLTLEHRMLLEAAAVCGVDFRVSTVADALERDAAWVDETCEALVRGQMWLTAPRAGEGGCASDHPYAFRHALFRRVMYERVGPLARVRLHLKVGAALERERAAGVQVTAVELATHFGHARAPAPAMRYYAEAAESAVCNLNSAEAMTFTEAGLTLLDQAPKDMGRDALDRMEITLATLRGVAATNVIGVASEARSAFQRAYARLGDVPLHPMRRHLLHGLGFVLCQRAEYAEALEVADRAEALSSETDDPVLMVVACVVHAEVHQLKGNSGAARAWIERGLAAARTCQAALGEIFLADPQITLLGLLSIELARLGLIAQGRAQLQQASMRASQLTQPIARLVAIWFEALFEVRLGDSLRVAVLADQMSALADEFALAEGRVACRWFHGWADARSGDPDKGYRRIRDAYEDNTRLGMLAGGSEVRGYAAEALLLAGDLEGALEQLAEAFRFADAHQERVYLSQLFLIEAAIAQARGQSVAACASIRRAIAEGRAQQAPWLELIALIALCEHGGAMAEDLHALAALVEQLHEANSTAAVARAKALLDVMTLG